MSALRIILLIGLLMLVWFGGLRLLVRRLWRGQLTPHRVALLTAGWISASVLIMFYIPLLLNAASSPMPKQWWLGLAIAAIFFITDYPIAYFGYWFFIQRTLDETERWKRTHGKGTP